MRRQDKYPDTDVFKWYNANPKNRLTGDCVFRALAVATEKPWDTVVREMAECSCKTGYGITNTECYERYLEADGWVKHKQPRNADRSKLTGAEFCKAVKGSHKRIVANIGGHHVVAIVDGVIYDTWNSSRKCIGNYWTKN